MAEGVEINGRVDRENGAGEGADSQTGGANTLESGCGHGFRELAGPERGRRPIIRNNRTRRLRPFSLTPPVIASLLSKRFARDFLRRIAGHHHRQ